MSFEQSRSSKYKEESKRIQGQQQQESGRVICFPNFIDFQVNAYVFVEELLKKWGHFEPQTQTQPKSKIFMTFGAQRME